MDRLCLRDVHPFCSVGLPVGAMILCMATAIASPDFYHRHVRRHEAGMLEQATVACLVPAVILGVQAMRHRRALPGAGSSAWCLLITAGALYFAGEECSWGQNYFHWNTPKSWAQINDQNETNLHNVSVLLDRLPRGVFSLAAVVCIVAPFVVARQRRHWDPRRGQAYWILPTWAVVPSAALAIFTGLPQRILGVYDKRASARTWYEEMFLDGRHSELKELFLALFLLMYLWSFATRLKSLATAAVERSAGAENLRGAASAAA